MMIKSTTNPIDNLLSQILQQRASASEAQPTQKTKSKTTSQGQDLVTLSREANNRAQAPQQGVAASNENTTNTTDIENGFRRTQNFTAADGREFLRIEEVTTTPARSKRVVIQQLDSGSTTTLENIIDRQDDGSFRLIQRFTNEQGETKTNVEFDFNPKDANVILGRASNGQAIESSNSPYQNLRGTQIDLRA